MGAKRDMSACGRWLLLMVLLLGCNSSGLQAGEFRQPQVASEGTGQETDPKLFEANGRLFLLWVSTVNTGKAVSHRLYCREVPAQGTLGNPVPITTPALAGLPLMDWVPTGKDQGLVLHPEADPSKPGGQASDYTANRWSFNRTIPRFEVEQQPCRWRECSVSVPCGRWHRMERNTRLRPSPLLRVDTECCGQLLYQSRCSGNG